MGSKWYPKSTKWKPHVERSRSRPCPHTRSWHKPAPETPRKGLGNILHYFKRKLGLIKEFLIGLQWPMAPRLALRSSVPQRRHTPAAMQNTSCEPARQFWSRTLARNLQENYQETRKTSKEPADKKQPKCPNEILTSTQQQPQQRTSFIIRGGRCARNWAQSDPPFRYLPEHRRAEFIAHSDSHLDMITVIVCSSLTIEQSVEWRAKCAGRWTRQR